MVKINQFYFTSYKSQGIYYVKIIFDIKNQDIFDIKTNIIINDIIASNILKTPIKFNNYDYQLWLYLECFFEQNICADIISTSHFCKTIMLKNNENENILDINQSKEIKFKIGSININNHKKKVIITHSKKNKYEAICIHESDTNTSKYNKISFERHLFNSDEPHIDKSAIIVCRNYLGLSEIKFSQLFGYQNIDRIHIQRVRSWENGKSSPPKSIQKIIIFIKIYGMDNNFMNFLTNSI